MAYVEALPGIDVDFGAVVWQALKQGASFPVVGAFWLRESESKDWRFIVVSPRVDEVGPLQAYGELSSVTRDLPVDRQQLLRIQLMSPKWPFYQALRSLFANTASVEGRRLGNTQIGGMYFEAAYLYEIR